MKTRENTTIEMKSAVSRYPMTVLSVNREDHDKALNTSEGNEVSLLKHIRREGVYSAREQKHAQLRQRRHPLLRVRCALSVRVCRSSGVAFVSVSSSDSTRQCLQPAPSTLPDTSAAPTIARRGQQRERTRTTQLRGDYTAQRERERGSAANDEASDVCELRLTTFRLHAMARAKKWCM